MIRCRPQNDTSRSLSAVTPPPLPRIKNGKIAGPSLDFSSLQGILPVCSRDGRPKWRNGRRTRLKIWRQQWHEGSSPSFGTILSIIFGIPSPFFWRTRVLRMLWYAVICPGKSCSRRGSAGMAADVKKRRPLRQIRQIGQRKKRKAPDDATFDSVYMVFPVSCASIFLPERRI